MNSICFYLRIHQPFQLVTYNFDQIGNKDTYENINLNKNLVDRLADTCYLPMNTRLFEIIKQTGKKFKAAISISGTTIELLEQYRPDVLKSFNKLIETGCIEVLAETYYNSLSASYSPAEFTRQVTMHADKIKKHFAVTPKVFTATAIHFNKALAENVASLGYAGMLCDAMESHVQGNKATKVFSSGKIKNFGLLLKNKSLSEDISLKFSDKTWSEYPLTASKFSGWINSMPEETEVVNLFMDFNTFGQKNTKESGIFEFIGQVTEAILKSKRFDFKTPTQIFETTQPSETLNHPADQAISFSGSWNKMQEDAIKKIYALEKFVLDSGNKILLSDWGKMQSADHFHDMSTEQWAQQQKHHGFFECPYDAHISFMNILSDIEELACAKKPIDSIIEVPVKKVGASKKKTEEKVTEEKPSVMASAKAKPEPAAKEKAADKAVVVPVDKAVKTKAISKKAKESVVPAPAPIVEKPVVKAKVAPVKKPDAKIKEMKAPVEKAVKKAAAPAPKAEKPKENAPGKSSSSSKAASSKL